MPIATADSIAIALITSPIRLQMTERRNCFVMRTRHSHAALIDTVTPYSIRNPTHCWTPSAFSTLFDPPDNNFPWNYGDTLLISDISVAAVAALRHVMRMAGNDNAGETRHEAYCDGVTLPVQWVSCHVIQAVTVIPALVFGLFVARLR